MAAIGLTPPQEGYHSRNQSETEQKGGLRKVYGLF